MGADKMIHIAICDDDALFLEELSGRVGAVLNKKTEYSLTKCTGAGQLLTAGPQDIVFLDIGMQGMDGMEAARKLRARGDSCRLVFLTAYPKYVFAAFDVEASHFLTKPVNPEKFRAVLLKLAKDAEEEKERYIAVRRGAGMERIPLAAILYVEVLDRKVYIHTHDGCYDSYGRLDQMERTFPEDFFRCHRSYIVHFAGIRGYDRQEITVTNGERIPVAKRKYQDFRVAFMRYLKKDGELL